MEDRITIDIDSLRRDLINYFGTAASFNPLATMNIIEVEQVTPLKLIEIAKNNNFNLDKYCSKIKKKY